jgi:hypothetical protein
MYKKEKIELYAQSFPIINISKK